MYNDEGSRYDNTAETQVLVKWAPNIKGKFVQGLYGPSTPDTLNYCSYQIKLNGIECVRSINIFNVYKLYYTIKYLFVTYWTNI